MSLRATLPTFFKDAVEVNWPLWQHHNNSAAKPSTNLKPFTGMNSAGSFQTMKSRRLPFVFFAFLGFWSGHYLTRPRISLSLASRAIDVNTGYDRMGYPVNSCPLPFVNSHLRVWIFHLLPQIIRSRRPAGAFYWGHGGVPEEATYKCIFLPTCLAWLFAEMRKRPSNSLPALPQTRLLQSGRCLTNNSARMLGISCM